jgi:hypothetical protein
MLILVTELVAIPLGSQLMERIGPNNTFALAIPLEVCSIPILFFIKETLVRTDQPADPDETILTNVTCNGNYSMWQRARARVVYGVSTTHNHLVKGVLPLLRRRTLLLALTGVLVNRFTRPVLSLLLQYASVKFHLRISQVSTLTG